jgi:hypothetical protein
MRPTKKSTTMTKTMDSLSLQNLHIPQIKNEEQNLRHSRKQELAHALEPFTEEDAHEDDDQAVNRELEIVQQKI